MSDKKVAIKLSTLENIGNAVRNKEGSTDLIPVNTLADRIAALPSGVNKLPQVIDRTITEITAEDLAGVTIIGNYAFAACTNLTSITIPDSITSIGNCALSACNNITSITIPDSVMSIGTDAFKSCTNLNSVKIGNGVMEIKNNAFAYCESLRSITIPNSVTTLGSSLFYNCKQLTTVRIGNGITNMDNAVFNSARSVKHIYIDKPENSISGAPWGASNATVHWNTPLPSEGLDYTLNNNGSGYSVSGIGTCTDTEIVIPSSYEGLPVQGIANGAFQNNTTITSVFIPDSVTSIGDNAFFNSSITSATIPNSVTSMGVKVFYLCKKLVTVKIGNGLSSIDINTFYADGNLTDLYIDAEEGSIAYAPWGASKATVHWNTPLSTN